MLSHNGCLYVCAELWDLDPNISKDDKKYENLNFLIRMLSLNIDVYTDL